MPLSPGSAAVPVDGSRSMAACRQRIGEDQDMTKSGMAGGYDFIVIGGGSAGCTIAARLPGPAVKTDADYFRFICQHSKTAHHPAGTCRMGGDPAAVVDPWLRFNGIDGLRIADASIMPRVISANTNAASIMIGEKAADMIRHAS